MGLLHAQNFEAYALGAAGWTSLKSQEGWTDSPSDVAEVVEGGWRSRRAVYLPAAATIAFSPAGSASTSVMCVQGAFRLDSLDSEASVFATDAMTLYVAADGSLRLSSSAGDHESGADVVAVDTWHYFELRAQMNGAGRVYLRIDGNEIFDASAVNVTALAADFGFELHGGDGGASWSEIIHMDGSGSQCRDLLGLTARIALLRPVATPPGSLWTGVSDGGSTSDPHHSLVDDPIPGANDQSETAVVTSANDEAFLVTFELAPPARSYEAVVVLIEGSRNAPSPGFAAVATIQTFQRAGAYIVPDPDVLTVARLLLELNPSGSKPWTRQDIAALSAGANTAS